MLELFPALPEQALWDPSSHECMRARAALQALVDGHHAVCGSSMAWVKPVVGDILLPQVTSLPSAGRPSACAIGTCPVRQHASQVLYDSATPLCSTPD